MTRTTISKTTKRKKQFVNKTRRLQEKTCPINLKPFMEEFAIKNKKNIDRHTRKELQQHFLKELMSKYAPHSIQPHNDFYDYINYQWLKNVTVEEHQKYIVQIDDFRLSQDKVYHQLDDIILGYIQTHNDKLAKNLKHFYTSVINMNSTKDSKRLAKESVTIIDKLIEENNPWNMLAYFNTNEMLAVSSPFSWSINPDDKQPDIFRSSINPHVFMFIDIEVYYNDGTQVAYKRRYRDEFRKYVQRVFDTCLGKGHGFRAADVFEVEVAIFDTMGCNDVTSKEEDYNRVYKEESLIKYGFDWTEFATCLGFKSVPEFFITSSLNYLKCGSKLFVEHWKDTKWRTYWIFLLLRRLVRITRKWENLTFDFYGKFERGQEAINKSDAVSASLYMSVPFNTFLTEQYMAKYSNPQTTEYVKVLGNDLLTTFRLMMEKNTWLSPKTKSYALYKLSKIKLIVGKPDKLLREDPDLDYTYNLNDNLNKIHHWRHQKFIELEGNQVIDIPMMDWSQYPVKMAGTQAYIVNASYTPSQNAIYINQGYIQKPFIDLDERGIEYNLAHIGFTLAHEMSHGFDDWGSQYDADGKLHDWWTPEDKKHFKSIQKDIIRQYDEFAKRDGINFDASLGVGEDMADISGMAICDVYLRNFQTNNNDIMPIRYLGFEAFYTYFAFQQRQFIGKKALAAQLKTNPHPLDKYRCNIPLSRSSIFRALYNVQRGDGMWWSNTNSIW